MKVMILGQFPWDWSKMEGGVESTLFYLADELAKAPDVRLQIVACHSWVDAPQTRERGPVRVTYLPRRRFGRITRYRRDIAAIQELIDKAQPDVVHGHGTSLYAGAALQSGRPAVVTVHGIVFRELNYALNPAQRIRGFMDASYERRCLRRTRYLIAIAPYVQREFNGLTRARVWNIPNAISSEFFAVDRQPVPHTILYPGVVTPRKAVHDLIRAVGIVKRMLPDVRLRIAGEAKYYPEYVQQVREMIAEDGLGENVAFLGFQSEEGVLREYARASVMALASHQETLPVVVQQAMAANLPLVSTAVGGVPDVVEHERTGLLTAPGDVEGLAAALLRLLRDRALADSLARKARTYAEENFHARAVAHRILGVYRDVIEIEQSR